MLGTTIAHTRNFQSGKVSAKLSRFLLGMSKISLVCHTVFFIVDNNNMWSVARHFDYIFVYCILWHISVFHVECCCSVSTMRNETQQLNSFTYMLSMVQVQTLYFYILKLVQILNISEETFAGTMTLFRGHEAAETIRHRTLGFKYTYASYTFICLCGSLVSFIFIFVFNLSPSFNSVLCYRLMEHVGLLMYSVFGVEPVTSTGPRAGGEKKFGVWSPWCGRCFVKTALV